jgi:hypothetical protein
MEVDEKEIEGCLIGVKNKGEAAFLLLNAISSE